MLYVGLCENIYMHVILYLLKLVAWSSTLHLTKLPKKVTTLSAVLQLQFCLSHDIVITLFACKKYPFLGCENILVRS